MHKTLLRYFAILSLFGAGTISIIEIGDGLHSDHPLTGKMKPPSSSAPYTLLEGAAVSTLGGVGHWLLDNLRHPMSVLLLQVIVILLAAKIIGALLQRVGQPAVIGEMIAGILLGPSLLGWLSNTTMTFL